MLFRSSSRRRGRESRAVSALWVVRVVVVVEGGRGSAHAEVGGFDVSAVVVLLEVLEFRGWVAGIGFLGGGVGVSRGCTAEVMVLNLASWPAATARAWTAEA